MDIYIYLFLLLLLIFLAYEVITATIKYCPIKIKEAIVLSFILISFRVGSLLVLLLVDDIKFVYLIRNFIFLNIIYIPMLMFISIYVFYRNTKLNINWIYGIFFIGAVGYVTCIFTYPIEYYISMSYGYNVVINSQLPYKILLCVNAGAFFIGVKSFRYKHSLKVGSFIICLSSLVFIGSAAVGLKTTEHIGYLLLGDLGWLISLYASILTFKIKAKGHNLKKYSV